MNSRVSWKEVEKLLPEYLTDVSTQMIMCFRLQGLSKACPREQCESRHSKVTGNAVAIKAKEEQPLKQKLQLTLQEPEGLLQGK